MVRLVYCFCKEKIQNIFSLSQDIMYNLGACCFSKVNNVFSIEAISTYWTSNYNWNFCVPLAFIIITE